MSIVIPNMEMPKACLYCRFHEMWNCMLCDKDCLIDGNIAYKERMDFCPLIEIEIETEEPKHKGTFDDPLPRPKNWDWGGQVMEL